MSDLLAIAPGLIVPMVMVAAVAALLIYQQKQRAQISKDTAQYQAGALAQRLRMRIERGHPGTNLFFTGLTSLENQHFDVLLRGEHLGVPIELVFYRQVQREQGVFEVTVHREWDSRLTARTSASFGHFEVTLRHTQAYNRVRPYFENPMPEVPTGDPRTDSLLRVCTDNPAIAAHLGALLSPLTSMSYVHVIGRPGEVSFVMANCDAGRGNEMVGVGYALHDAERIYDVLARIVLAAEGRG